MQTSPDYVEDGTIVGLIRDLGKTSHASVSRIARRMIHRGWHAQRRGGGNARRSECADRGNSQAKKRLIPCACLVSFCFSTLSHKMTRSQ